MTTYQPTPFLSEILRGGRIPEGKLAYFRARLSNKIHELVLSKFLVLEQRKKLSKADLAKRLGRKPEQITRWLGAPGNWTIDTFSDLMLGMGLEPTVSHIDLAGGQIDQIEEPKAKQEASSAFAFVDAPRGQYDVARIHHASVAAYTASTPQSVTIVETEGAFAAAQPQEQRLRNSESHYSAQNSKLGRSVLENRI